MKKNEVKILQLISSGGYYGAENMLLNLCASQEKAGCRNSLLLFYNVHTPNVEFYERARRRGISVRMVHCRGRADWRAVRQIEEYIAEDAVDVVHTHGYKADLYGYLAARNAGKPIVAARASSDGLCEQSGRHRGASSRAAVQSRVEPMWAWCSRMEPETTTRRRNSVPPTRSRSAKSTSRPGPCSCRPSCSS